MMLSERAFVRRTGRLVAGAAAVLIAAEFGLRAVEEISRWARVRPRDGTVRILCLGESGTAARYPFDDSWPAQLQTMLDAEPGGKRYRVVNRGRLVADTRALTDRLPWLLDVEAPRIVITMMGAGDAPRRGQARLETRSLDGLRLIRAWRRVRRAWGRRLWLSRLETLARSDSPDDQDRRARACRRAGADRLGIGDLGVCLPALESWAAHSSSNWLAQFELGAARWAQGDHAGSSAAFKVSAKLGGADAESRIARFMLTTGNRAEFERHWEAAWSARPWVDELLQLRFDQLAAERKEAEAAALARRAIERFPGRGIGHFLLFHARLLRGRRDEATLREGEEALRLDPQNPLYRNNLAAAYAADGRWAQVEERLEPLHRGGRATQVERYRAWLIDGPWRRPEIEGVAEQLLRAGRRDDAARLYDMLDAERDAFFGFEETPPLSAQDQTRAEYARIGGLLRERGVFWIALQYPLRSLKTLRADATLVENRENFLAAQRRHPDADLFIDRFAGDFGDCTSAGNRLLAESAARAVRAAVEVSRAP